MAQITAITMRLGLTINEGNFESVRPEVELTAEIDSGEDIDAAREQLGEEVERLWFKELERARRMLAKAHQ